MVPVYAASAATASLNYDLETDGPLPTEEIRHRDLVSSVVICLISFHRFNQFKNVAFDLKQGVSLLGGGNNSGKSTILHGLAV